MNTHNQESKDAAIKTLAIIGFVAAAIVAVWLVINIVAYLPAAFKQLASITDGLYGNSSFSMTVGKNIVNSGEPFAITWTKDRSEGTYEFMYRCVDGVSADFRKDNAITAITCGKPVDVTSTNGTIDLMFRSERQRFSDVSFSLEFIPRSGERNDAYEKNGVVTVANVAIPLSGATSTKPVTGTPAKPTPTPATKPPVKTTTVSKTVTGYPTSNAKGYADLEVTFMAIGYVSRSGRFVEESHLEEGEWGAVQFMVKNIGTKTSGEWRVEGTLPLEDGEEFNSREEKPLRPGEYSIMTIDFGKVSDDEEEIEITVKGGNDSNYRNNSFEKWVRIK